MAALVNCSDGGSHQTRGEAEAVLVHPLPAGTEVSCLNRSLGEDSARSQVRDGVVAESRMVPLSGIAPTSRLQRWQYRVTFENGCDEWLERESVFPRTFGIICAEGGVAEKTLVQGRSLGDYRVSASLLYLEQAPAATTLRICGHCLHYLAESQSFSGHQKSCTLHDGPGAVMYEDKISLTDDSKDLAEIKVCRVSGEGRMKYCRSLLLLVKAHVSNTLQVFDAENLMFYVLMKKVETEAWEMLGFFCRDKDWSKDQRGRVCYNLSNVFVPERHRKQGFGTFLVSLSYDLAAIEGVTGTPERPLGTAGKELYDSYWKREVLSHLGKQRMLAGVSVRDVSLATKIFEPDVQAVLKKLNMLKQSKGELVVSANAKSVDDAIALLSSRAALFNPSVLESQAESESSVAELYEENEEPEEDADFEQLPQEGTPPAKRKLEQEVSANPEAQVADSSPANTDADGAESGKSKKATPHKFTPEEVDAIRDFISLHGIAKVRAPMNTPEGLPRKVYQDMAASLRLDYVRCKEKIKRVALDVATREKPGEPKALSTDKAQADEGDEMAMSDETKKADGAKKTRGSKVPKKANEARLSDQAKKAGKAERAGEAEEAGETEDMNKEESAGEADDIDGEKKAERPADSAGVTNADLATDENLEATAAKPSPTEGDAENYTQRMDTGEDNI
mmetsp:Transcript_7669/g.23215  ORF Transcript_7669/g.23215 Transcript_7669/m.23215 type:complete len:678 (+) Transcript_7669:98-2131(+)